MSYEFSFEGFSFSYFESDVGSGKTLALTIFAVEYSKKYPNNIIYSNVLLDLHNFRYIPDVYLPHTSLNNCFIGLDDSRNSMKGLNELITTMENMRRKNNLFVFLVGHDKTDFLPRIRENAEYKIIPYIYCNVCGFTDFNRENQKCKKCNALNSDILEFVMINRKEQNFWFKIDNPLQYIKYYNTKQVVNRPSTRNIIEIIKENSKTLDDLEINISTFTKDSRKKMKLYKQLSIELGFLHKDTNFNNVIF